MGQKNRRSRARQAFEVAVRFSDEQNFVMAARLLKQAVQINPKLWDAHIRLAEAYCGMEMFEEALEETSIVLRGGVSHDWQVFFYQGHALGSLGQYQLAVVSLTEACRLNSECAKAYEFLGQCHCVLENYEYALAASCRAEELGSRSVGVYSIKAASLVSLGMWEPAYNACRLALALEPNNASSLSNYGVASLMLGSMKEASGSLHRAAEIDPSDPIILATLGNFYKEDKKYGMALSQLREALALAPRDGRIRADIMKVKRLLAAYN